MGTAAKVECRQRGNSIPGFEIMASGGSTTRRGVATLDYVLVLGVVLPLAAFLMTAGPKMIRLAYEMVAVLVSWPWM